MRKAILIGDRFQGSVLFLLIMAADVQALIEEFFHTLSIFLKEDRAWIEEVAVTEGMALIGDDFIG